MNSLNRPIVSPLLVGRASELERVETALRAAQQGAGECVFVSGDAGIGKSRVLAEARRWAAQAGCVTLQGHCFEQDASFPYALWIDLLRASFARLSADQIGGWLGPHASELLKLLPELALSLPGLRPSAPLDPEAEKRRLFEALVQFLTRLTVAGSGQPPLLVVVEDLHWSDETSLDFLHFFARRLADFPILLLASYRREDVSAPLAHLLAQLNREHRAEEIVLRPLGLDEVAAMVQAIFNIEGPIKLDFLDRIVPLSEGNPFFVEEILKTLVEEGDIFFDDGRWQRKSAHDLRVPRSVRDAVRRRVGRLSPAARRLVTVAAVAGYRFDFPLLQQVSQLGEAELMQHIKELIAAQLVVEESLDHFAFRHALTREAIYTDSAQWLARERKAWHQIIAEALERNQGMSADAPLSDLARHFFLAGAWDKALEYSQRAGDKAQALYAPREALDHFTQALEAAQHLSIAPPFELLRARAKARETLGEFEPARGDLEAAQTIARASGDSRAEWQATLDLGFLWAARDYARSGEYMLKALDTARRLGDPASVAHTLNRVGNWHMNRDEPSEAQRYHEEALHIFQQLNDQLGLAETLELLGVTSYVGANTLQGVAYCEQAIPLFRQSGDRQGLIHSLTHLITPAQFDTEVGEPVDIRQRASSGDAPLQLAREMNWRSGEGFVLATLAEGLAPAGDYARALEVLSMAAAIGEEINHRLVIAISHWIWGQVYGGLLAFSESQQHLEQARAAAEASHSVMFTRITAADLASIYTLQNEFGRAEVLLRAVPADRPAQSRHLRMCWNARAELALAQGDPTHALRIADDLMTSAPNIERYGSRGIPRLSKLRGEALAALGRRAEAEAALLEAREGAREQGRRPLLWRIQVSLGKLYRTIGRGEAAEREFAAARGLIRELAGPLPDGRLRENFVERALAMIPAQAPRSTRRAVKQEFGGLTAREREVAVLIAQGKTNAQIAGALVTSRRTAEKHVGSILSKLGFTSRAQVVAWAIEKGLTGQTK